jgi:hypothetical protein
LSKWLLDRSGLDGNRLIPPGDLEFADLLIRAASGLDVEAAFVALLRSRTGPGNLKGQCPSGHGGSSPPSDTELNPHARIGIYAV